MKGVREAVRLAGGDSILVASTRAGVLVEVFAVDRREDGPALWLQIHDTLSIEEDDVPLVPSLPLRGDAVPGVASWTPAVPLRYRRGLVVAVSTAPDVFVPTVAPVDIIARVLP